MSNEDPSDGPLQIDERKLDSWLERNHSPTRATASLDGISYGLGAWLICFVLPVVIGGFIVMSAGNSRSDATILVLLPLFYIVFNLELAAFLAFAAGIAYSLSKGPRATITFAVLGSPILLAILILAK